MFDSDGSWLILFFCLLSIWSIELHTVLGFFYDSTVWKNEFFLSLIVFLYWFLFFRYFWCSFEFLLSHDFIQDSSSFWWSLTMVGSFIQGAIGQVNFTRCVGAWLSKQSLKSLFKIDTWSSVLRTHTLSSEVLY